jgi:uncharacterized membrane protein
MAARKAAAAPTGPGGGAKSRNKGTRGGRPEASAVTAQRPGTRPARTGSGPAKTGNGQARSGAAQAARARAAQPAPVAEAPAQAGPPSWLQWTTWVLSIVGLGVSTYLTIVHYSTAVSLACPESGTINCEKVVTSPQSVVFGIPVAVLGLAFYVFLVAANSPWAWRSRRPTLPWSFLASRPALYWARVASMVVGIVFVLYLIYTELFTIKAICLWCTSVHVITFFLFVLIVFSAAAGYGAAAPPSRTTTS